MANTAQARKRTRQNTTRRRANMSVRSAMRTAMKRVLTLIGEKKDAEAIALAYRRSSSLLDRAQQKNLIHKNKAARHKRRLNALIKNAVQQ